MPAEIGDLLQQLLRGHGPGSFPARRTGSILPIQCAADDADGSGGNKFRQPQTIPRCEWDEEWARFARESHSGDWAFWNRGFAAEFRSAQRLVGDCPTRGSWNFSAKG